MLSALPSEKPRVVRARYRFDSAEQIQRHFQPTDGMLFLYVPRPIAAVSEGMPAVVEIAYLGSDQSCALHGRVAARDPSGAGGFWVEFWSARHALGLQKALYTPLRRHRRFATDQVVYVSSEKRPATVARVLDIGMGGLRLTGLPQSVVTGEALAVSATPRASESLLLVGSVAWIAPGVAGLAIPGAACRKPAFRTLVEQAQEQWARSVDVAHPLVCACVTTGKPATPPLPRAAFRQRRAV
jgi:hypothetical protein